MEINQVEVARETRRRNIVNFTNSHKVENTSCFSCPFANHCKTCNLQNIHTPFDLCYEMVNKTKDFVGDFGNKVSNSGSLNALDILAFNLEFVEVLVNDFGVEEGRISFLTDCPAKAIFCRQTYSGVNVMAKDFFDFMNDKKQPRRFDAVVMNPPYQAPSKNNNKGAGNTLWGDFVRSAIDVLNPKGFMVAIHPSGWRNVGGRFLKTKEILDSKQIEYLEIHNADDGIKTFGAGTRYDWYVLKNEQPSHETMVVGEDHSENLIDLRDIPFIPNGNLSELQKLMAKSGEERVNILYSCSYHSCNGPVRKTSDETFKYPCIQHVSAKDDKPSCIFYSSTNQIGHFGISKVIFGVQVSGALVDSSGIYGMAEHCASIVDSPENLEKIKAAMKSERFIELMKMCDVGGNRDRYNRRVISHFRHDFWKEFV